MFLWVTINLSSKSFCQKPDSLLSGTLKGVVWDSSHTTVLHSATLAVYGVKDSILIAYTLSNNYGEFSLKGLPTDVPLKIVASFVNYKVAIKLFYVSSSTKILDIGHINMMATSDMLEEVIVNGSSPPIRMKGDTLEFNADAFKLNPNAQTEDLLRILPGVTVWSDGTITVNGREVSSVLVNGKRFFNSDARVATQNIPKNVVDKIQVYQKDKSVTHTDVDSTTEINIKLKKGKDVGYFGKLNGGYGTGTHYELDANLNFFNRKSQFSIAATNNNINKIANSMSFLLLNNTFKGTSANVAYQSNFLIPGFNTFTATGLFFQHDFIPTENIYNTNRISADYFFKKNKKILVNNTQTITSLNDAKYFIQNNNSIIENLQQNQDANFKYEKRKAGNEFSVLGSFGNNVSKENREDEISLINEKQNLLSRNVIFRNTDNILNNLSVTTTLIHQSDDPRPNLIFSAYDIAYRVELIDEGRAQDFRSTYKVLGNQSADMDLARLYNNKSTKQLHNLVFNLPDFGASITGGYRFAGIEVGIKNELEIYTVKDDNNVKDKNGLTNKYQLNTYLSNIRNETVFNANPALIFKKNIRKSLSDRYSKDFSTDLTIGPQFYNLSSSSEKVFQEFSRAYQKLVMKANFHYVNTLMGSFTNIADLQISSSSQYPTVDQLAPLIDSANFNFIQRGNIYLKEQNTSDLKVSLGHSSLKAKNVYTYSLSITGGYVQDYFTNSNSIDTLGRNINTIVNADGFRFLKAVGDLKKNYKLKNSQFQFTFSPTVSVNRTPNYVNSIFSYFNNKSLSYNPAVTYNYKEWFAAKFAMTQTYNKYSQKSAKAINISNLISQSEVSFSINFTKKLSLASNAIHTINTFNQTQKIIFTIWNASIYYRMLKSNNAELKFSGLDLLGQNTGLINYGFNNSVTQGKTNILQKYFLLTLSWFPRKFGK